MGKGAAAAAAETKKRKKKGRPSLLDLQKRNLKQQEEQQKEKHPINPNPNSNRRSTRHNPASDLKPGNNDDDDDDERKEKKVKPLVRLPPSVSLNLASEASDSNADGDKPEINHFTHRSAHQLEKVQKAMDTLHGPTLDSGPTTPLPDKTLLVFILDRLQKKDTYGVFSEPVDPDELPDYHEIIDHPMDFQTVRKKLDEDRYSNLEEFEADVFLICSNAMEYNASDTVYFRQARTIQEVAKRDFQNLRQVNDDGEPQPRIVRRGRPPGKNPKSSFGSPPIERVGPESTSDATLATGGDNGAGSNSYNLRRGPISSRFQSNDAVFRTSNQYRNNETCIDWSIDWNSEFPASVLKAEAKHAKKQFSSDENRRATYKKLHPSAFGHESSVLATLSGDVKQLMKVGLHAEHGYARSLSRFAANLGPAVWKIASMKIKSALPAGVEFGPGWVGVNDASPRSPSGSLEQKSSNKSSLSRKEDMVESIRAQNSDIDSSILRSGVGGISHGPSFQTLQKHMLNPDRNGFNGVSHYDHILQMASAPSQMLGVVNHIISEPKLPGSSSNAHVVNISNPSTAPDLQTRPEVALSGLQPWQGLPVHGRQYSIPVPPDLNVRFQAQGSPNSSFRIGSPQQPDLALQL
ncbi:hypothetical protein RHGRI_022212 [Rhododendron griersonianum]|uniref:Bromo domain-containing protein n=1 Tax=Rhododendron griersonianum TaxID=479676 RepID=A0AAV6JRA9_9ERIC|nr:hypothetical protein RHGRI_022212 [Rhododendron griersonianum]